VPGVLPDLYAMSVPPGADAYAQTSAAVARMFTAAARVEAWKHAWTLLWSADRAEELLAEAQCRTNVSPGCSLLDACEQVHHEALARNSGHAKSAPTGP
jgi:hypothetical protein